MDTNIKDSINQALAQPMDRREFLARTGAVVLTVVGVTSVIKAFTHAGSGFGRPSQTGVPPKDVRSVGYGSSPYGR